MEEIFRKLVVQCCFGSYWVPANFQVLVPTLFTVGVLVLLMVTYIEVL